MIREVILADDVQIGPYTQPTELEWRFGKPRLNGRILEYCTEPPPPEGYAFVRADSRGRS